MDHIIGAFIFPDVWQTWTESEANHNLETLAGFGINTIFTESETYRNDLIEIAHRLGLLWFGGIACFSDHLHNHQLLRDRPELWPIVETGQRRPQMEWYVGVTPGFEDYNTSRLELMDRLVRNHNLDGLFLDFIRWPVHWELELRPGTPKPLQSSFDSHTLSRFQVEANIELPSNLIDVSNRAHWILTHHLIEWTDFKCKIITDFVHHAVIWLRRARGQNFTIGLYALPFSSDILESLAGQRLQDLTPLVDWIAPMTYHAILYQPVSWVGEIIRNFNHLVPGQILPVLQVDSTEGAKAGADWGPPISVHEWEEALRLALAWSGKKGLIAFTGIALLRDKLRLQTMSDILSST
jgi:hypothetical protein